MRFDRKGRKDIKLKTGSLFNLIDNVFKTYFCVNDQEYDYILSKLTDEDLSLITSIKMSYSECKYILNKIDGILNEYYSLY